VRSRRGTLEQEAKEGKRGARAGRRDHGRPLALPLVVPARDHADLSGHRLPRRARRGELVEPLFGDLSHTSSLAISLLIAYLLTTSLHITIGEQVPKIYAINKAEPGRAPDRAAAAAVHDRLQPVHPPAQRRLQRDPAVIGISKTAEFDEGGSPEELKVLIAQSLTGGKLDPGEADAHGRLPPARAAGAPGDDAGARGRDGRPLRERRDRAARCVSSGHTRLVVTEDENHDRVKGIVHANALAQLLLSEGPEATIEELVREAPIVPETKPLDDLLADLQRNARRSPS
jgi:CBS domain containing-hemolysin-like protein